MAEFQWWLLIVGVVTGGALVALVLMDARRREVDLDEVERRAEINWIAAQLRVGAEPVPGEIVEAVLDAHREYLGFPPPDRFEVVAPPADSDSVAHTNADENESA